MRSGVKLIVVACNSATATALSDLQQTLEVPVIGVLTPEARAAVQLTRNRRVGLLATEATVASGRYREVVRGLDAGIELVEVPARAWPTRSSAARPTTRRWSSACACTARRCASPASTR